MLDWRAVIVPFPWPVVKFVLNYGYLFLGEIFKVGSFRVVLPDESVQILVAAALVGTVGIGKVYFGIRLPLD